MRLERVDSRIRRAQGHGKMVTDTKRVEFGLGGVIRERANPDAFLCQGRQRSRQPRTSGYAHVSKWPLMNPLCDDRPHGVRVVPQFLGDSRILQLLERPCRDAQRAKVFPAPAEQGEGAERPSHPPWCATGRHRQLAGHAAAKHGLRVQRPTDVEQHGTDSCRQQGRRRRGQRCHHRSACRRACMRSASRKNRSRHQQSARTAASVAASERCGSGSRNQSHVR